MPNNNLLVVHARWIAPVIPEATLLEDHSLVIKEDRIVDLLASEEARERYPDAEVMTLNDHILTPGLVNAHGHAAMTLLRGYADDRPLMDWLENYIWPLEAQVVDPRFVYDGTTLAVAEMIRTGTTCAADTYFFPAAVARAFSDHKFRGQVCMPVLQFPSTYATDEDDYIHQGLAFRDDFVKHDPLVTTAFAPHSPYTVTDKGFEKILRYAEELPVPIHLHLHETSTEVQDAVAGSGKRPFKRMSDMGLLSPNLQTVHMTQLNDEEIEQLAVNNVHVAHCPESNLKLASGFCPVDKLRAAGVNVAIGTDGAASNNNLDMLEELRTAMLLAKAVAGDPMIPDAHEALAMATINGARLLGLDDKIGSLEAGKLADFIAVDMSAINLQPIYNPVSQLAYVATGQNVSHVWINGELVLEEGEYLHLDVNRLRHIVAEWQTTINRISL